MQKQGKAMRLNGVRLSYVHIFKKKDWGDNNEAKYQCRLLIHPDNKKLLTEISRNTDELLTANFGSKKANLKRLLNKEPEEMDGVVYYYINANTNRKPTIVNRQARPINDEEEIYSGCYANAQIYMQAFSKGGNKGISAILDGIQKIGDGDRLDGRAPCEFEPLDSEEEETGGFEEFKGEVEYK
jgi:hypothetical protein